MFYRFILAAVCLAVVCGGPVSSDNSSTSVAPPDASVATSQEPDAQAPKLQDMKTADEGSTDPEVGGSPPNSVVEEKKPDSPSESENPPNADVQPPPKQASEVVDMMIDPYSHPHHNHSTPSPDPREEEEVNSDTVTVNDPHVSQVNKTHEEEGNNNAKVNEPAAEVPKEGSPQQAQEKSADSTTERKTEPAAPNDKAIDDVPDEKSELSVTDIEQVPTLPVSALAAQHDSHSHPIVHKGAALNHTTQVAGILAGALVAIALLGYAGLLVWRRVLEKRYGNREMLVNEDDDFKHFEL